MRIQKFLEEMTMVRILDGLGESCRAHFKGKGLAPISGYTTTLKNPEESYRLIIWSEDARDEKFHYFATLDVGAVIRDSIDDLASYAACINAEIASLDDKVVQAADADYRKQRDGLRAGFLRLKAIAEKAIADIDDQSVPSQLKDDSLREI